MLAALDGVRIAKDVRSRTYYKPFFQASVTVLKNYNVVYVENSKVACTKIKKVLLSLDNWPLRAEDILEKEVHIHNKEKTGMIGPEDLTMSGLARICRDPRYFRFGFVRNPYDRTLSAYIDKVLAPQKDETKRNYIPVAQQIKASFTGDDFRKINLDKDPVSFSEFVSYIAKQRAYSMDRHWLHQYLTMWHPHMKYDFIGRLESFSEDFASVLKRIRAPQELVASVAARANASRRGKKKYYTKELAEKVYSIFRKDFELYGYDPSSWDNY